MEYTHKKIDEYNQNKELKILVKLVIRLLICVERSQPMVTKLLIAGSKLNISLS